MNIIRSPVDMQNTARTLRAGGKTIGFVPTMGFLHEGHVSLIRLARRQADVVVVSIYVNPAQFGPNEDFSRYPRDFQRDEKLCGDAGTDIIFYPTPDSMYEKDHSVWVSEESLSRDLCGASRPGHFRGVCTIVAKLFNMVQPDFAVFGEKDGQQLRIIERMVRDLNFTVRIVRGPTVRETDGLAMSSRNAYLSAEERPQALCLRRSLDRAEELCRSGEHDSERIKAAMSELISHSPRAKIDYIGIVDDVTLEPVSRIEKPTMIALAVYVGKTRLIDNTVIRK